MAKETKIDLIKLDPNDAPKESPPDSEEEKPGAEDNRPGVIFRGEKLIFLLGLGAVVLLGGAAVAAALLGWIHIPGFSAAKAEPPSAEKKAAAEIEKHEMGQVIKLTPLVTNLKEENGRNYLKATIVLEIGKKGEVEEVQSKIPILTDAAILTLSDKRLEDLKQPEAKEHLKQELLAKMNQYLELRKIRRIYFDEFLYQ